MKILLAIFAGLFVLGKSGISAAASVVWRYLKEDFREAWEPVARFCVGFKRWTCFEGSSDQDPWYAMPNPLFMIPIMILILFSLGTIFGVGAILYAIGDKYERVLSTKGVSDAKCDKWSNDRG